MNTHVPKSSRSQRDESHYNARNMDFLGYRNQITEPANNSEPVVSYEYERQFLLVTSADRNRALYPDPANFHVTLPNIYRDILSIELYGATLPNLAGISNDAYVLMDVPELNHIVGVDGTSHFGVLSLNRHPSNQYLNMDRMSTSDMPVTFRPLKDKLYNMTIRLKHPDGSQVTFGSEPIGTEINMVNQVSFVFQIKIRIPNIAGIARNRNAPVF